MGVYEQDPLTARELDIVRLLARGLTDREIAERLVIAPGTVRWYNKQIYGKLHASNRTQAAQRARELGLLPMEGSDLDQRGPRPSHNLPLPLTPFVGRKRELGHLTALLRQDDIRLVTILAPGGMGKSRLALEVARSQIGSFLHGIHYISLEGIDSARHILPAIAQRLDLRLHTTAGAKQQLLDYLGDRWLLFLFDGFEGVIEGKEIVRDMLSAIPGLKVLITSRLPLDLEGETLFSLGGLDYPHEDSDDAGTDYGSAALFLQSARRSRPNFTPDKAALAEIRGICRTVQGMPLAIVLAAAWVSVLPPVRIREDLERSLNLLQSGTIDMPERHSNIHAVFDYAWGQLSPDLRDVYAKLSVFRGGFTREAASSVAGATLSQIAALADHALLTYDFQADRYELHALLKRIAFGRLATSGQLQATRRSHMSHYIGLLDSLVGDLKGGRQLYALQALDADFENLREAWLLAVAEKDEQAVGDARDGLFWFCQMRGRVPDGEELLNEARLAFRGGGSRALQRQLLIRFDAGGNDYRKQLEAALADAHDAGDPFEIALLHWALGVNGYVAHNLSRAIDELEQALDLFELLDEYFYATEALHLLGFCSRLNGETARADVLARRALELARASGNKIALARALGSQAVYDVFRGDLSVARAQTEEALALRTEHGDLAGIAMSKAMLGLSALLGGKLDEAQTLAREAMELGARVGHASSRETANTLLGWIACMEEDYELGQQLCDSSHRAAPDPTVVYMAAIGLAFAACGQGLIEAARARLDESLTPMVTIFGSRGLLACLPALAVVTAHDGQAMQAVEWLAVTSAISEETRAWVSLWPASRRLMTDLEAELGTEAFAAAWEKGLARMPADVAAAIRAR